MISKRNKQNKWMLTLFAHTANQVLNGHHHRIILLERPKIRERLKFYIVITRLYHTIAKRSLDRPGELLCLNVWRLILLKSWVVSNLANIFLFEFEFIRHYSLWWKYTVFHWLDSVSIIGSNLLLVLLLIKLIIIIVKQLLDVIFLWIHFAIR